MDFIELVKIVLLGVIEGITEWLPISSTGHILLLDSVWSMRQSAAFKEIFTYFVQLGAIFAVIVLFFRKLCPLKRGNEKSWKSDESTWILWGKVGVACIPAAIAGVLLDGIIPDQPWIIASALIFYGALFLFVERSPRRRAFKTERVDEISWAQAAVIGFAQVLSIIPGTSRSGITILAALLLGIPRPAGAEFTFFLAIPVMVGASLLKLVKFQFALTTYEFIYLFIGFFVAFFTSLACIKFLMKFVKEHDFFIFGWYRILLGSVVFAVLVIPSFF